MERLKGFLAKGLKELNAEEAMTAGRVFAAWPTIVGEAVAKHARPRYLRHGVLFVEVSSSAWANELSLLKPRFLSALSARLGRDVLRDLRYQVAPTWRERGGGQPASEPPARQTLSLPSLAPETVARIQGAIGAQVEDPGVARSLEGLMGLLARRQEAQIRAGYRPCASCGALVSPQSAEAACPVCRLTRRDR